MQWEIIVRAWFAVAQIRQVVTACVHSFVLLFMPDESGESTSFWSDFSKWDSESKSGLQFLNIILE